MFANRREHPSSKHCPGAPRKGLVPISIASQARSVGLCAIANWPDWYALYMVRERTGEELPT
jgi:hypothetical protein